jgi:glycosyltransferase involved in cell wall biosynthesis
MNVLSIHWGFSLGGVGKYAQLIDKVNRYEPAEITSLCILGKNWWYDQIGLETIKAKKIFIKSRFDLSWVMKVANIIDELVPDLIMTHGFNGHFVAWATRLLTQKKHLFICSYHGSYHATTSGRKAFERIFDTFTEWYIRWVSSSCIAVAEFSKNHLVKKGVPSSKVIVIHNGISDKSPSEAIGKTLRREWEIADNEILIGAASRLDPVKGIEFLFEAFIKLSKIRANLKLVIIGSGTLDRKLQSTVRINGLSDRVIFAGFREDVPACLNALDIFAPTFLGGISFYRLAGSNEGR